MKAWAVKRKLAGLGVMLFLFLLIVGFLAYYFYPRSSCTDGRMNGKEEGIDCGGLCQTQCIGAPRDPQIIWSRFFQVKEGEYDVGALIENINVPVGVKEFRYTFRLYDNTNILLDKRSGLTTLHPNERAFIYEAHLQSGNRRPVRVEFEYDAFTWERMEAQPPFKLDIVERQFQQDDFARLYVTLANRDFSAEKNLEVFVLLERNDGNVYAVSRTIIESIAGEGQERLSFVWPRESVIGEPATVEILYRRLPR